MHVLIVRIHLAPTLVDRHEYWLNARCGLCHQRGCTRRGYCQAGDIPASVPHHILIELRVGLPDAVDKRIVLFALCVVNLKCPTLFRHRNRRTVGIEGQGLVHADREVGCLLCSITESHSGYHVALGSDADSCTASHSALAPYLFPKVIFRILDLRSLRVALDFSHDEVYLLHFEVDNVVHQPLRKDNMLCELFEIETGILRKRIDHIRIKVDGKQAAAVIRAKRYLTASW